MTQHIWSVLCRSTSTDANSNNVSLFEVTEQLQANVVVRRDASDAKVAPVPIELQLITLWRRDSLDEPERGRYRVVMDGPDGIEATGPEAELNLEQHPRLRTTGRIGGIPTPIVLDEKSEHTYWFSVELFQDGDWRTQARIPLELSVSFELEPEPSTE